MLTDGDRSVEQSTDRQPSGVHTAPHKTFNQLEFLLNYKSYFEILISVMMVLFQSTDIPVSLLKSVSYLRARWVRACIRLLYCTIAIYCTLMLRWLCTSVLRNKLLQRTTMKWLLLFSKMKELVNSPSHITNRYEETRDCVQRKKILPSKSQMFCAIRIGSHLKPFEPRCVNKR